MSLATELRELRRSAVPLNSVQQRTLSAFIGWLAEGGRLEHIEVCAACETRNFESLQYHDRFGLGFGAFICRSCGLVSTSPRIKDEQLPEYYRRFYLPLTMGVEGSDAPKFLVSSEQGAKIYSFVAPYFLSRSETVLDVGEVGCGPGGNLAAIRDQFARDGMHARVTGCEYSEHYADYASNQLGITYVQGGLDELLAGHYQFDLLVLSHVFEHMVDLRQVKEKLLRLLKPQGLLYVEVPGLLSFQEKAYYQAELRRFLTHAHVYNFSLASLMAVMQPTFEAMVGNEDVQALFKVRTQTLNVGGTVQSSYEVVRDHLLRLCQQREAQAEHYALELKKWREQGRVRDVESALVQLLLTFPDSIHLANLYAEVLFELGKLEQALSLLHGSVEVGLADETTFNNLAVILWESGEQQAALGYFKRALDLNPGNRETVTNYGEALTVVGNVAEASDIYETYLKIDPQDREVAHLSASLMEVGKKEL